MKRRDFLTNTFLAATAPASSQSNDTAPAAVTVHPDQPLGSIPTDFMGLGYEISSVARPGLLSEKNKDYVHLVRTLAPRGIIRIGGNTSDYSSYSPTTPPVSSPMATVVNDAVLRDLGGFLQATGWKLIWGLNLGKGSEADAVAEAKAVLAGAGKNLLAFEIGNEPDLFPNQKHRPPGYGYEDWLAEYRRYKTALRAQFPKIPFAGPDAAVKTDWVTRFAADEANDTVLLTHHYYREGQNPTSTIEKLLGVDPKLQPQLSKLSDASRASHLPYRICEVNSFSGGGRPGVSDTMAGALWVLDYMFTLAANGCSGVNMETGVNHRGFISSYSPIGDDEQGHYSAKPEYYGMLAFAHGNLGQLVKAETEAAPQLKAFATRSVKGSLAVTLINKGAAEASVNVNAGSRIGTKQGPVTRLSALAVDAKTGVTLGGAEVSSTGSWLAKKPELLAVSAGRFRIKLPPASAAIVHLA